MSARQSPAAVQDMELGMVDHHSPYPEAYINPSTDPMSPPLIWRDSSASNNATLVNGQAPNNNYHARVDSYFSNGSAGDRDSMTHLLAHSPVTPQTGRRPTTGNSTASGFSSRTVSVNDVSSYYKDKTYYASTPDSRPSTPSAPLFPNRKATPSPPPGAKVAQDLARDNCAANPGACGISAEALIPLPRPSKDAPAPPKQEASWWIRANLWYNTYRKFFTFVVILNGVMIVLALSGHFHYARNYPGAMVLGNLTAAILVRNELFGRFLYLTLNTLFAKWSPLWFRLGITSVLQHLGGIHSGCALSGTSWLIINLYDVFHTAHVQSPYTLAAGVITNLSLVISMAAAFPWVRNNHHNIFERYHRFVGWTGLVATWFFVILGDLWSTTDLKFDASPMHVFGSQAFWFALTMTIFVILPWCFVRKVPVQIEIPSPKVAILRFERGMQQGLLGRISRSALKEYHAFGIISAGRGKNGEKGEHFMICGVQGDFTKSLVNDPPSHIWTRELKFAGVSNTSKLYKRGIRICTGTGLGAALSTCIQDPNWFLIWVGADMEKTFGPTISALIHDNLGPERVLLWDSKARGGRPNTMKILREVVRVWRAEVVFITSNYEGNKEMMEGCKESGIPVFGTLWDF